MRFLTIDVIKKHLNLDANFNDDNALLEMYGEAAEDMVENLVDNSLENIIAEQDSGSLPKPLLAAMLLLVGNLYLIRESVSQVNFQEVPHGLKMMIDLYKDWSKKSY